MVCCIVTLPYIISVRASSRIRPCCIVTCESKKFLFLNRAYLLSVLTTVVSGKTKLVDDEPVWRSIIRAGNSLSYHELKYYICILSWVYSIISCDSLCRFAQRNRQINSLGSIEGRTISGNIMHDKGNWWLLLEERRNII